MGAERDLFQNSCFLLIAYLAAWPMVMSCRLLNSWGEGKGLVSSDSQNPHKLPITDSLTAHSGPTCLLWLIIVHNILR